MEKDALTAGVSEIGGLFTTAEIRVLICYIFSKIDDAVPGNLLANTLHYEGIANCFEVNDSIDYLCKSGQLELVSREDDTYRITESGKDVAETLKTTLSIVVKERAYNAAIKMVSRFRNTKETDIKITELCENVGYHNESYYINIFRKKHGITPLQYRKKYRK